MYPFTVDAGRRGKDFEYFLCTDYQASTLSKELASLSPEAQKRILQMVELMIRQEKENPR